MLEEAFFRFHDGTIRINEAHGKWGIWIKGRDHKLAFSKINRETITWFLGICQASYSVGQVMRAMEDERVVYLHEVFEFQWGEKMDQPLLECLSDNSQDGYLLDQYILLTK